MARRQVNPPPRARARVAAGRVAAALLFLPALALGAAPADPPRPPGGAPPKAGTIRFAPQPRGGSSYRIEARVEVGTTDVTFDVPAAYTDSFKFWAGRMKGSSKQELYQFLILTDDALPDGLVPFRKQVSRFQIEMQQNGQSLAAMSDAVHDMPTQAWEGRFDRNGNVKEMRKVAGQEDADMKELATAYVEALFPPGDAPRDLAIGESVKATSRLPLPSRLTVEGLETMGLLMTRELRLKTISGDFATFEVKTTYANDPEKPSSRPETSCAIGGGGSGEATFDVRRGVYVTTRQPSTLTLDLEAPLRRLPQMPETEDPGKGKGHIRLDLLLSGSQEVHKIIGED